MIPSSLQTLTIPTIDTTKLPAGQLSVVQELPEVSRLVFQEVKAEGGHHHHHHHDSIVNILQMKSEEEEQEEEEEAHSLSSPLDYTVNNNDSSNHHNNSSSSDNNSLSPLNLVNNSGGRGAAKGVKRVMAAIHDDNGMSSSSTMDPTGKRMRNLVLLQDEHGQHIIHQLASPGSGSGLVGSAGFNSFSHLATIRMTTSGSDLDFDSIAYLDDSASSPPPMTSMMMKAEEMGNGGDVVVAKSKSASSSPGRQSNHNTAGGILPSYPTKTVAGTVIPSSKTCNWVFENGQVCGKTFSKSYNLVVHMRMHEDIRPFACTLCDQTFRQKAHLQRHETTHGIQSKNFYRNPASRRKKRGEAAAAGKSSPMAANSGLLQMVSNACETLEPYPRRKMVGGGQNSDGEEFLEDEEDDLYVPNGGSGMTDGTMKQRPAGARKYSDTEARGEDREPDSDSVSLSEHQQQRKDWSSMVEAGVGGGSLEDGGHPHQDPMGHQHQPMMEGEEERPDPLNLVARHSVGGGDDDDTSTVASILNTVNSVPTLEQKLESSYQQLHHHQQQHGDSGILKQLRNSISYARVMEPSCANTLASLSLTTTSNNNNNSSSSNNNNHHNIPLSSIATTLAQQLPGATTAASLASQSGGSTSSSILYTTLAGPGSSRLVLEGLAGEEHSPEIQAELLNALLADESYPEEIVEEEVYRLNTLPPTWWVSRRRKPTQNQHHVLYDVTYYSPEGFGFRTRGEIQNFLQHDILSRDAKLGGLRQPPIPIESIPIIDDDLPQTLAAAAAASSGQQPPIVDTNSIAAALIANLKPEPLENLQEVYSDNGKMTGGATSAAPLSTC